MCVYVWHRRLCVQRALCACIIIYEWSKLIVRKTYFNLREHCKRKTEKTSSIYYIYIRTTNAMHACIHSLTHTLSLWPVERRDLWSGVYSAAAGRKGARGTQSHNGQTTIYRQTDYHKVHNIDFYACNRQQVSTLRHTAVDIHLSSAMLLCATYKNNKTNKVNIFAMHFIFEAPMRISPDLLIIRFLYHVIFAAKCWFQPIYQVSTNAMWMWRRRTGGDADDDDRRHSAVHQTNKQKIREWKRPRVIMCIYTIICYGNQAVQWLMFHACAHHHRTYCMPFNAMPRRETHYTDIQLAYSCYIIGIYIYDLASSTWYNFSFSPSNFLSLFVHANSIGDGTSIHEMSMSDDVCAS